jgi:DNA ligase-1
LGEAYEIARTTGNKVSSKWTNKGESSGKGTSAPNTKYSRVHKQWIRGGLSQKRKAPDDEPAEEADDDNSPEVASDSTKDDTSAQSDSAIPGDDELAEINGVKPKTYMRDGEEREAKSMTRYVYPRPPLTACFNVSCF